MAKLLIDIAFLGINSWCAYDSKRRGLMLIYWANVAGVLIDSFFIGSGLKLVFGP